MINNAHDAIVSKGVVGIWIKIDKVSYAVESIIAGAGVGILSKMIGQIFEPFFTTKGVGKGTGMELVDAGMNTSFYIKLPISDNGII